MKSSSTPRMCRLAWATDLHLNFCDDVSRFTDAVCASEADAVLIGGDIAEAPTLEETLVTLVERMACPIYFVLGNHDYYHGSVDTVREVVSELARKSTLLRWLPEEGVVELSSTTALVGHGGWSDGRYGDYAGSTVLLNDYRLIDDFVGKDSQERLAILNRRGDEAASYLRPVLANALERFENVLVLTHVPPFREATWHEGQISSPDFLPHFSCKAVGDVLLEQAKAWPAKNLLVLCGHTHSPGVAQVLPNLRVLTGGAEYSRPCVQMVIDADTLLESPT